MTGVEHFREAERLLNEAGTYNAKDGEPVALIQRAGVHATLALAAATIDRSLGQAATWVEALT